MIFVFGSNLAGRHGAGAAKIAVQQHGATYGMGEGLQGNSYAIPTKDVNLQTMPLKEIAWYVQRFLDYARDHSQDTFQITQIGCGLAGYQARDMAPFFVYAPKNCQFDLAWRLYLPSSATFWGTYP